MIIRSRIRIRSSGESNPDFRNRTARPILKQGISPATSRQLRWLISGRTLLDSLVADVFTPQKRSEVMSRIRGRDTRPELALRSMLHRMGYRFTVNGPLNRRLPGKPDLVLPKYQTVIFVHGCFWHGHENCPHFRIPGTRTPWWTAKITGNQSRDLRNENTLRSMGWHVVTIWECALKTKRDTAWLIKRLPVLLEGNGSK